MTKSLVEILTEARDSLTSETWRKGQFFRVEKTILCMCAHGALLAANPVYKNVLQQGPLDLSVNQMKRVPVIQNGHLGDAIHWGGTSKESLHAAWNDRYRWIKKDTNEDLSAHFLLGMVGLTTAFNDHHETTLAMVHKKLNEAIAFAQQVELEKGNSDY